MSSFATPKREKRVVYEPVDLPQDFRSFDFLMPWEGPEYILPGDEKASRDSPARRRRHQRRADRPANAKTPGRTPKTTESRRKPVRGAPADAEAKKQARKPAAAKAKIGSQQG